MEVIRCQEQDVVVVLVRQGVDDQGLIGDDHLLLEVDKDLNGLEKMALVVAVLATCRDRLDDDGDELLDVVLLQEEEAVIAVELLDEEVDGDVPVVTKMLNKLRQILNYQILRLLLVITKLREKNICAR